MLTKANFAVHIGRLTCIALGLGLVLSATAQASLQVSISTGGPLVAQNTNANSGGVVTFSGTQDDVQFVFISGSSNSPGAPPQSTLNISSLDITNNSDSLKSVQVQVSATDFNFPAAGLVTLTSGLGGSVTFSGVNSVIYQTWIDASNTLNGYGGITSGPLSADASGIGNGGSLPQLDGSVNGDLTGTPFSFTGLVTLDLEPGAAVNFATTAVLTPVPEATSLLVWGAMLIPVGLVVRRSYLRKLQA
ncbi:hypothetical protein NG895_15800 [Aeoliella sp. ICT_H6.2]|uniref:PEP-CTERM protein-sorting domain-containing protein n=1 Tax=Aeoliella straminimaris TaxID=2954799 RepID=A0A9X2JJT4_9BACT|nr:hypothetical protein [Aeoliella straminimaris]MCO6045374.1 hypothetical protein [Aeoliella straminimaris]